MKSTIFRFGKLKASRVRRNLGFSIVELMIVVAIIGVLAAIAVPNYQEYTTRARIAEAVSGLSDMRVKMERHFQDNRTYIGSCVAGTQAPLPPATASFTFSCVDPLTTALPTATTFTVAATGTGSMTGFVFSIDQDNVRRTNSVPSGWVIPPANCWVLSKAGGC